MRPLRNGLVQGRNRLGQHTRSPSRTDTRLALIQEDLEGEELQTIEGIRTRLTLVLEELEEGIYIDKKEDHKGYIIIPKQITGSEFSDILIDVHHHHHMKDSHLLSGGF